MWRHVIMMSLCETTLTPKEHNYTEYVVNMQKALPKQPPTLIPDAVRKHQKKKRRPYLKSKAYIIRQAPYIQKISANSDSRNDKHAEKLHVGGVRRVLFIASEQGR